MRFQRTHPSIRVYHENHHLCGRIDWDNIWDRWVFTPATCGLSEDDVYEIYKFMRSLR